MIIIIIIINTIIFIINIIILYFYVIIIIPTAPRIPLHQSSRRDKRRGVMSLVG